MYCDDCGSILNEHGTCPICGWQKPSADINQSINNNPDLGFNTQPDQGMNIPPNQNYNGQVQGFNNQPNQNMNIPPQGFNNQPDQNMNIPPQGFNNQPNQGMYSPGQGYGQPPYRSTQPPKQKKKWPVIVGIIALILVIAAIVLIITKPWDVKDYTKDNDRTTETITTTQATTEVATTEAPNPTVNTEPGSKTIMLYMVGSNLESEYDAASTDLDEILNSGFDDEEINFLIYTGGSKDWEKEEISDIENSIFIIEDSQLTLLQTEEQKNMGSADTLSGFINYCYDNYPAEQYGLILWNHGGGSFVGYGLDELSNDCLTLMEMGNALSHTPFKDEARLEWVGFDACLMANIEVANTFAPYANYMIASQEPEPGWGWDFGFLSDAADAATGADMGKLIVDSYITTTSENFIYSPFSYSDITLSVMDLSKVDEVETALDDLFTLAGNDLDATTYNEFAKQRDRVKEIAPMFSGDYSYDNVDMVDLCDVMSAKYPTESNALKTALSDMIVYQDANVKKAHGVSIYYPYNSKANATYCIPMYKTFDFAPAYASYIEEFGSLLTNTQIASADWNPETMMPMANSDLTFTLSLTPEQAAETQNVYYVISRADTQTPGNYVFVSMSNQVEFTDATTVTANFDGQIIYMQNDTTGQMTEIMYTEQESTDEYTRYLISSILYDNDIQEEEAMYTYFVLETTPSNPTGTILGAYPISNLVSGDANEIFPERYEIDINEYNNVAFGYFTHEFTSTEDLTNFNEADWADVDLYYNYQPISEGFSPVMSTMRPDIPYYGMFIIEDTQGNRHCSNLVQLQ